MFAAVAVVIPRSIEAAAVVVLRRVSVWLMLLRPAFFSELAGRVDVYF